MVMWVDDSDKSYALQKQERYAENVFKKLVKTIAPDIWTSLLYSNTNTFPTLMRAYPDFPVKLDAYKHYKPIAMQTLIAKLTKTPIYKQYEELGENYPGDVIGLIFTSHGGGYGDLVLHNSIRVPQVDGSTRVVVSINEDGNAHDLYIDHYKSFLEALKVMSISLL